jgi:hypothetical protein
MEQYLIRDKILKGTTSVVSGVALFFDANRTESLIEELFQVIDPLFKTVPTHCKQNSNGGVLYTMLRTRLTSSHPASISSYSSINNFKDSVQC